MITGRDVICISSIEWDFLWQGHQEIATRLAQAGNRVLFIENTGIRTPGLSDFKRVGRRLRRFTKALFSGGVRAVRPNVYVCSPIVLPPFGSAWRRKVNRYLLLPIIVRAARRLRMRDYLLWTYLPTDTVLDLINLLDDRRALIYYCVDNFTPLTPFRRELHGSERALVTASNIVFATCPELASYCRQWNENVYVFPFGVNLEAFSFSENGSRPPLQNVNQDEKSAAADDPLPGLTRPIIGYVGGIHRHVDFGLLAEMARARPQWSWVLVGRMQAPVGELAELPNVYLLGQKPHAELVHYIRAFDVCVVPYVNSHYTATVVPTKINEYLAVGKPIVSTNLPAVCEFNNEHDVLRTASPRPKDFLKAIEDALSSPGDAKTKMRRREVAELGDWESRLQAMSELIAGEFRAKRKRGQRRARC